MSLLRCLLFVTFCFAVTGANSIQKRSIDHLGSMILRVTGRNSLDFNGYGRWCGFGGSGTPVDSIDRCCMAHDHCYGDISKNQCKEWLHLGAYVVMYKWDFYNKEIHCLDERSCHQVACQCDKNVTNCFLEHLNDYNKENQSLVGKTLDQIFG